MKDKHEFKPGALISYDGNHISLWESKGLFLIISTTTKLDGYIQLYCCYRKRKDPPHEDNKSRIYRESIKYSKKLYYGKFI